MSPFLRMACACAVASVMAVGCSQPTAEPAGKTASAPQASDVVAKTPAQPTPPPPVPQAPKPLKVVKTWNFLELEKPHWQWQFPKVGAQETEQGAFYHVHASGPGPQLTPPINIQASDISAVRLHMQVMRRAEGEEKPKPVELPRMPLLLWASPEDVQTEGWVFTESKVRSFELLSPENNFIFQADLRGRENWRGEIARLAVTVPVPEDLEEDEQPYSVFIRRIEFLK